MLLLLIYLLISTINGSEYNSNSLDVIPLNNVNNDGNTVILQKPPSFETSEWYKNINYNRLMNNLLEPIADNKHVIIHSNKTVNKNNVHKNKVVDKTDKILIKQALNLKKAAEEAAVFQPDKDDEHLEFDTDMVSNMGILLELSSMIESGSKSKPAVTRNTVITDNDNDIHEMNEDEKELKADSLEEEVKQDKRRGELKELERMKALDKRANAEGRHKAAFERERKRLKKAYSKELSDLQKRRKHESNKYSKLAMKRWKLKQQLAEAKHQSFIRDLSKSENLKKQQMRNAVERFHKVQKKHAHAAKEADSKYSKANAILASEKKIKLVKFKRTAIKEHYSKKLVLRNRHIEQHLKQKVNHYKKKAMEEQRKDNARRIARDKQKAADAQRKKMKAKRKQRNKKNRKKIKNMCLLYAGSDCPNGWKAQGEFGMILLKDHYSMTPFTKGSWYNNDWRWTHPNVCCAKKSDSKIENSMYIVAKVCPSGSKNMGIHGLIVYNKHLGSNPFRKGVRYDKNWTWVHPYVCQVNSADTKGCFVAKRCPSGWKNSGLSGIIEKKSDYKHGNPFAAGNRYNDKWQWSHPYICCR